MAIRANVKRSGIYAFVPWSDHMIIPHHLMKNEIQEEKQKHVIWISARK